MSTAYGAGPLDRVDVLVRRLDPGVPLPAYAHPGDAGADLHTTVDVEARAGGARAAADRHRDRAARRLRRLRPPAVGARGHATA